jgi:hypothetical protein
MPDEQSISAELIAVLEGVQPEMPSAEPSETSPHEESAAMIDIHDAHHAASSWRDFFIHIATIVLGLIIAVSLEQTVEYFHHRQERRQLEDDLRAEAERRVPLEAASLKVYATMNDWYGEAMHRARAATVTGGFVTFVLPDRPPRPETPRPEFAVWPAAKTSGQLAYMPNQEVEGWDRVDYTAQRSEEANLELVKANDDLRAIADRLGISLDPAATVHVTPEERDELTRACALRYEKMRQFMLTVAASQGASEAAMHGAMTANEMQPYIARARATVPQ